MFKATRINAPTTETKNNETTTVYDEIKSMLSFGKHIDRIFTFFFWFKTFHLWNIAVIMHFIAQVTVFIGIMNLTDYEASNNKIIDFLGISWGKITLYIMAFLVIRICFELILVVLGIHNKLSDIADSLKKMEKKQD